MQQIQTPKAATSHHSAAVRYLTLASTGLAVGASIFGLTAEVVEHFQKPAATPNERTKLETGLLALTVLKAAPGIIKSVRTVAAQMGEIGKSPEVSSL